jgi:signal transduction histidine kinase
MRAMLRKRTLERKLFAWLLLLAVAPALLVLAAALGVGSRSLAWLGTLGAWTEVGESGQALFAAIQQDSVAGPTTAAAERHRAQLSESLGLANRWTYLGARLTAAAPLVVGLVALLLAGVAALVARRLARDLARPIEELTTWAPSMARGEALPPPGASEGTDVAEVRALRQAMRSASTEIGEARLRAVETERTRVWGEMARRVAHEMKNPLTPLRLAAIRLSTGVDRNSALAEAVSVIEEETNRLDDLAKSFALLGRPPSGPATEIDIAEMFQHLLQSDVPASITGSLEALPDACIIHGHYDALLRAFRNLLRNAVEAVETADGPGRIEVIVRPAAGGVEVIVADNGIGIPAGAEKVIFEPDRTWKAGGTGLGLAVVQQVVASHGGTIEARGRSNGGSEFVVQLPNGANRDYVVASGQIEASS